MMERRLGRFVVARWAVESRAVLITLMEMEFVPLRVECLGYGDEYEYIGTSPLFRQTKPGSCTPKYSITVNDLEDGEISVSVEEEKR